ncbi:hypothetical protein KI387_025729, partial [Taxus chinensis]
MVLGVLYVISQRVNGEWNEVGGAPGYGCGLNEVNQVGRLRRQFYFLEEEDREIKTQNVRGGQRISTYPESDACWSVVNIDEGGH